MINDKVVYTLDEALDLIRELDGKCMCMISLYKYKRIVDNRGDPTSVVVDKILVELEDLSKTRKLHEILTRRNIKHYVAYSGEIFYVFIITEDYDMEDDPYPLVAKFYKKRIEPDLSVYLDIDPMKQIVLPNTYNCRSRRYSIPLSFEEIETLSMDQILDLSSKRRGKIYVPEVDQMRKLDLREYE